MCFTVTSRYAKKNKEFFGSSFIIIIFFLLHLEAYCINKKTDILLYSMPTLSLPSTFSAKLKQKPLQRRNCYESIARSSPKIVLAIGRCSSIAG